MATIEKGQIAFLEKGLPAVEEAILARRHMYAAVYGHHTSRIAERMLARAVRESGLKNFWHMTDGQLLETVHSSSPYGKKTVERIRSRRLLKRAFVLTVPLNQKERKWADHIWTHRSEWEQKIAAHLKIDRRDVIIDRLPPRFGKLVCDVLIKRKDGQLVPVEKLSALIRTLKNEPLIRWYFAVYTPHEQRESANRLLKKIKSSGP